MNPNTPYLPGKFCQADLGGSFQINGKPFMLSGDKLYQGGVEVARVLQIDRYGFRFQAQVVNNTATGYVAFKECSKLNS